MIFPGRYSPVSLKYLTVLVLWLLQIQTTVAQDSVRVNLFEDSYCKYPSRLSPNVTIPLSVCILTPGMYAFFAPTQLCVDGTEVRLQRFYAASCSGDWVRTPVNYCAQLYPSPLPAFAAYCGASEQIRITSTTAIPIISALPTRTTTTQAAGRATATTTAGQGPAPTDSSGQPEKAPSGWSALSNGERIGAIIALAVGIPSVLVGGCAAYIACRRR